jgi:LAGLIDADG-like domain
MRNQQGTPSDVELAWLAGFIEGEGTLALSAWNRFADGDVRSPKVAVTIKVYNTDAKLIQKCRSIIRKLEIEPYLKEREQKPMLKKGGGEYVSHDPMLTLTVSKQQCAKRLLNAIRPHLFGDKATRADLMIEYLDMRIAKIEANGGNFRKLDVGPDEYRIVEQFYTLTRNGSSPAVQRIKSKEGLLNE